MTSLMPIPVLGTDESANRAGVEESAGSHGLYRAETEVARITSLSPIPDLHDKFVAGAGFSLKVFVRK